LHFQQIQYPSCVNVPGSTRMVCRVAGRSTGRGQDRPKTKLDLKNRCASVDWIQVAQNKAK